MFIVLELILGTYAVFIQDVFIFSFPLGKAELLEKWVLATKRKNFVPNKYTKLCNKHFTSNDFLDDVPNPKRKRLKPDAVPTIFNFPGHLQKSQPKKRRTIERRQSSVSTYFQGKFTQLIRCFFNIVKL